MSSVVPICWVGFANCKVVFRFVERLSEKFSRLLQMLSVVPICWVGFASCKVVSRFVERTSEKFSQFLRLSSRFPIRLMSKIVIFGTLVSFFILSANDRGYGHLAVCGSILCRETTKWMREQNCRNARQPANAHRRVLAAGRWLCNDVCSKFKIIVVILFSFNSFLIDESCFL